MPNIEIGSLTWIAFGILGYLAFTAFMAVNYREHMRRHRIVGVMLLIVAVLAGPVSLALFVCYAILVSLRNEAEPSRQPVVVRSRLPLKD